MHYGIHRSYRRFDLRFRFLLTGTHILFLTALAVVPPSLALAFPTTAATTCATVGACVFGQNTSNGPGLEGTSSSGFGVLAKSASGHGVDGSSSSSFGVVGRTLMNATSVNNARAGVYGIDASTNNNPYNSGVAGVSHNGFGVLGESINGAGVEGFSTSGGAFSLIPSYSGVGVYGNSNVGPAVYGVTTGTTADSYGVGAYSNGTGITSLASFSFGDRGSTFYARTHQDGYLFVGASFENGNIVKIDGSGNIVIAGTVTQNGSPLTIARTPSGEHLVTYVGRSSAPYIEDFGQAQLVNGHSRVALDARFASTIDRMSKYMVFITPHGQSNGIYVSNSSVSGFTVEENGIPHSSLSFDYRIVARPYDAVGGRLDRAQAASRSLDIATPTLPVRK